MNGELASAVLSEVRCEVSQAQMAFGTVPSRTDDDQIGFEAVSGP